MTSAARLAVLEQIVEVVAACDGESRRIAVDGPDAAGKTTVANELASLLACSRARR